MRFFLVLAMLYLAFGGYLASQASFGALGPIGFALGAAMMLAATAMYLWLANRCRRGAQATAQAHPDR